MQQTELLDNSKSVEESLQTTQMCQNLSKLITLNLFCKMPNTLPSFLKLKKLINRTINFGHILSIKGKIRKKGLIPSATYDT